VGMEEAERIFWLDSPFGAPSNSFSAPLFSFPSLPICIFSNFDQNHLRWPRLTVRVLIDDINKNFIFPPVNCMKNVFIILIRVIMSPCVDPLKIDNEEIILCTLFISLDSAPGCAFTLREAFKLKD